MINMDVIPTSEIADEEKGDIEQPRDIQEKTAPRETCPNCGAHGDTLQLQQCGNGHLVCPDCLLECHDCGTLLCGLCSFDTCSNCNEFLCSHCVTICSFCEQKACRNHYFRCESCQSEGCAQCMFLCPECQRTFCEKHFNRDERRCLECSSPVNGEKGAVKSGTVSELEQPVEIRSGLEENSVPSELKAALEVCPNCGVQMKAGEFQKCSNGHGVCSDCLMECGGCEKKLCLQCSSTPCEICDRILCSDCTVQCSSCGHIMCRDHIVTCDVCQKDGCPRCLSVCPECQGKFCAVHYDQEKDRCERCLVQSEDTMGKRQPDLSEKVTPAEITKGMHSERECNRQGKRIRYCWSCGHEIEDTDATYCIMCGEELVKWIVKKC